MSLTYDVWKDDVRAGRPIDFGFVVYVPERTCRAVQMVMAGNPPYNQGDIIFSALVSGCSQCGFPFGNASHQAPNYCPNCGARVEEASDDAD